MGRYLCSYISRYIEGSWFHALVGNLAGMDITQYGVGGLSLCTHRWSARVKWALQGPIPPSATDFALEFSSNLVDCILSKTWSIWMNSSTPVLGKKKKVHLYWEKCCLFKAFKQDITGTRNKTLLCQTVCVMATIFSLSGLNISK